MSKFSIQIKNSFQTGETLSVDVTGSTKVLDIKKEIERYWNIPPQQQNLVYTTSKLENDSKTVSELNIVENSVLYLIASLKGGII